MASCYETSCFCAPIRWIRSCFDAPVIQPQSTVDAVVHNVSARSINSLSTPPSPPGHTRNRTWVLVDGKMRYEPQEGN